MLIMSVSTDFWRLLEDVLNVTLLLKGDDTEFDLKGHIKTLLFIADSGRAESFTI